MSKFDPDHGRCMVCYEMQPDCWCDADGDGGDEARDRAKDEAAEGDDGSEL